MARAIIVCCIGPYTEPKKPGDEIWACTTAFRKPTYQKGIDRLYFMDPLREFVEKYPGFVDEVNALACEVLCLEHYPEIPGSRPYPVKDVLESLGGYFTSSIAYMIAHAVFEEKDILLHRVNSFHGSAEYLHQKDCHDFWCGYAKGRGLSVETSPDSFLMKPHPWCAPIYGYTRRSGEDEANRRIRGQLQELLPGPVTMTEGQFDDIALYL